MQFKASKVYFQETEQRPAWLEPDEIGRMWAEVVREVGKVSQEKPLEGFKKKSDSN